MSRFTQPVMISQKPDSDGTWIVETEDLVWEVGEVGSGGRKFHIPKGSETDLASVPRVFWSFVPPFGRHTNAAILHDWLYRNHKHRADGPHFWSRKFADEQFHAAMLTLNVPGFRAALMYRAVRIFGFNAWRKAGK